ncbi:hypothetical protein NS263_07030 [Curtobacterium oceanosedimentum]|uniref:Uncharacterized protein n=1 Tax=Curtobacterium oceanosedimentum TaxID=465820 RepID=A0ABR5S7W9_9MICO|nr:hypothetical protein NS263_07030 [Curtobacterium oceanosedimentum]
MSHSTDGTGRRRTTALDTPNTATAPSVATSPAQDPWSLAEPDPSRRSGPMSPQSPTPVSRPVGVPACGPRASPDPTGDPHVRTNGRPSRTPGRQHSAVPPERPAAVPGRGPARPAAADGTAPAAPTAPAAGAPAAAAPAAAHRA